MFSMVVLLFNPSVCDHVSVLRQVVKICRECLEKQENVLADTHLYRLRVLSVAGEVLSFLQNFGEAAGYAEKMVEGYK